MALPENQSLISRLFSPRGGRPKRSKQSIIRKSKRRASPRQPQFGDDADYWTYADAQAEKCITETADGLKSHLDNLLVFAALFSGVNSGFVSSAIPLLSGNGQKDPQNADPGPIRTNQLFSISLTCSILASFGSLLAQQWVLYYKKNSGVGSREVRRQRELKRLGALRWRLEPVVELVLPGLLQAAVFIFGLGLVDYLGGQNSSVALPNLILASLTIFFYASSVVIALWDPYCPFQTTFPKLIVTVWRWRTPFFGPTVGWIQELIYKMRHKGRSPPKKTGEPLEPKSWLQRWPFQKTAESQGVLGAESFALMVQDASDSEALQSAARNILLLDDSSSLRRLSTNAKTIINLLTRLNEAADNGNEDDAALLCCALSHIWMAGRQKFGWRFRQLDSWYGAEDILSQAARAFTTDSGWIPSFPSTAIPILLIDSLRARQGISNEYIIFLERTTSSARDARVPLGLIACYLVWSQELNFDTIAWVLRDPVHEDCRDSEDLCQRVVTIYQKLHLDEGLYHDPEEHMGSAVWRYLAAALKQHHPASSTDNSRRLFVTMLKAALSLAQEADDALEVEDEDYQLTEQVDEQANTPWELHVLDAADVVGPAVQVFQDSMKHMPEGDEVRKEFTNLSKALLDSLKRAFAREAIRPERKKREYNHRGALDWYSRGVSEGLVKDPDFMDDRGAFRICSARCPQEALERVGLSGSVSMRDRDLEKGSGDDDRDQFELEDLSGEVAPRTRH